MAFDSFNTVTAKKVYAYRPHPHHAHSFLILREHQGGYEPVGDYTVLDSEEDRSLSEKKVMNLIALMNDEDDLIDLRAESKKRILYYKAPCEEPNTTRIVFYALGDTGVSQENAVLSLNEEMTG